VSVIHLRAGGVSLVLDATGGPRAPLPVVLHWGPDLGAAVDGHALAEALVPAAAHSAVDRPVRRRLLPMPADGWRLRPGWPGTGRTAAAPAPRSRPPTTRPGWPWSRGCACIPRGSWRPVTPCATWATGPI